MEGLIQQNFPLRLHDGTELNPQRRIKTGRNLARHVIAPEMLARESSDEPSRLANRIRGVATSVR